MRSSCVILPWRAVRTATLWQEQQRILRHFPLAISEAKGYQRDPQWRPLMPSELITEGMPQTGREYFDALGTEPTAYYWLKDREVDRCRIEKS